MYERACSIEHVHSGMLVQGANAASLLPVQVGAVVPLESVAGPVVAPGL